MPVTTPNRGVVSAADLTALYADADVLPLFPGRGFIAEKTAMFGTNVQKMRTGREVRRSDQADVLWRWKIMHEFVRNDSFYPEVARLWAFYCAAQGRFKTWFFYDPSVAPVVAQTFGTGNGTTTTFAAVRQIGAAANSALEIVRAFWNAPAVTVNGVSTPVTVNPWGAVVFASPPANGAVLRWSGTPLYVCRFDEDEMSMTEFAEALWEQADFGFVSLIP